MIYDNAGGIRDLLKQDLALEFCRKKDKDISILTEKHINHDQIHHQVHTRSHWLGPIFFSPGDIHTKGSLLLPHPGLEGITEVDTDPKEGFVSFKATPFPLMTEFSVFIALQGTAPGNSCARGWFFKGLQNYMENKMREMKTK